MTAHSVHPSIRENGLADGCDRCGEHARGPFEGLDSGNLESLIDMIVDGTLPRTTNEAIAMARIKDAIDCGNVMLYPRTTAIQTVALMPIIPVY